MDEHESSWFSGSNSWRKSVGVISQIHKEFMTSNKHYVSVSYMEKSALM